MSEMLPKSDNPGVWHREIFDSIHDAVFVHDPVTGRIESMNRRAEAMWGIRREEVGMPTIGEISANVPPYTQVEAFAWIRRTMEEGPQLFEWQARHAEGRVFWVEINMRKVVIAGDDLVVVTVRDITRRKEAENDLRRSEERYALAASGSTAGVWDWDIHTGGVYYSTRFRELLGYSLEEFPSLFFSWEQKMHPDDLPRVQSALEAHLERREPFCVEHRVRVKSGEYRWFEARGQALWDQNDMPYRMAGSALDVHERKLDEQKLLRLNKLNLCLTAYKLRSKPPNKPLPPGFVPQPRLRLYGIVGRSAALNS